jgi:hypothetical protein
MEKLLMKNKIIAIVLIIGIAYSFKSSIQQSIQVFPQLIYPGNEGFIQLSFKNVGSAEIDSLKIENIEIRGPIKIEDWKTNLGSLNVGDTLTYSIKFKVDENAKPGIYTIQFKISYCEDSICRTVYPNAIINVQSYSNLEISRIYPPSFKIGEKSNITIKINNKGESDINNLIFTWNVLGNYSIILPFGIGNKFVIPQIKAGSSYELKIPIIINPLAHAGTYSLLINLDYIDNSGNLRSTSFVTGIEITSETDFDISVQEFSHSSLSLVITNIGSSSASSVIVKILPLKDLIFVPETSVIGNLNPGDYATATFSVQNLNVSKETSNITRNLKVEISYTDTSGIRRKVEKEIPLTSLPSSLPSRIVRSERYSPQSNLGIIYILVGIIGIIALVAIFKKLIRGKRK